MSNMTVESQLAELAPYYEEIGQAVAAALPTGWRRAWSRFEWLPDRGGYDWSGAWADDEAAQFENATRYYEVDIDDVGSMYRALTERMDALGSGGWKACLFTLESSGQFSVDYEYEDPTRWDPSEVRFMERLDPDGRLSRRQRDTMLDAYGGVVDNGGTRQEGIEAARRVMAAFKR